MQLPALFCFFVFSLFFKSPGSRLFHINMSSHDMNMNENFNVWSGHVENSGSIIPETRFNLLSLSFCFSITDSRNAMRIRYEILLLTVRWFERFIFLFFLFSLLSLLPLFLFSFSPSVLFFLVMRKRNFITNLHCKTPKWRSTFLKYIQVWICII